MKSPLALLTSLALVLAAATAARADIDIEIANGDTVTGTISPATEVETFRFRVPKDAVVTVRAKALKKGPLLHLSLRDPVAAEKDTGDGKAASIVGFPVPASGVWSVAVTSADAVASGNYSISISWKSRTSFSVTTPLDAAAGSTLAFSADAGATATLAVKPARRSAATGALVSLAVPNAADVALTGVTTKLPLASGGDHVLTFTNTGAATGDVIASVKLKAPKLSRRKITLTATAIGPGGAESEFALANVLNGLGGTVSVPPILPGQPGAEISGSAVVVPPGALGAGTAIVIATAPPIGATQTGTDAGPTVLFGPEGQKFADDVTVTIPYDSAFDGTTDSLVIYTRNAKGKVTPVPPPYTFDTVAHTVSFATSHFSSFGAQAPAPVGPFELITYGNVLDAQDVCLANDTSAAPALFFVAEGSNRTVAALRQDPAPTSAILRRDVWAGGGTDPSDGTPRLQFQIPGPVTSVFSTSDERVFFSTQTQVFLVDASGFVTRFAGTGTSGDTGDGGPPLSATFMSIGSILADTSGAVFIADAGAHRIRYIDPLQSSAIVAWAGSGTQGVGSDGGTLGATSFLGPQDMEYADDGGLYVADGGRVRHLTAAGPVSGEVNVTVAGGSLGETGSGGDGGPVLAARFRSIAGVSRYFDPLAPTAIKLAVSDSVDHTLRLLDLTGDDVTLLAGQHGVRGFDGDIGAATGRLDTPGSVVALSTLVVFVDQDGSKIRVKLPQP